MLKWGIIGAGNIARRFAQAVNAIDEAELWAVSSRSFERAKQFALEYGAKCFYSSYEELVNAQEINAVYISTLHPFHYDHALMALKAKKPVLCEKPLVMNSKQAKQLIAVAKENKTFLMEAMWTRFLPVTRQVVKWVQEGMIGEVRMLNASFGFVAEWNPESRVLNKELGGGALLDVGVYTVSYAAMLFGTQPTEIKSIVNIGATGVDEQAAIIMKYDTGQMAVLECAICTNFMNQAEIIGTEGRIVIPSFFGATEAILYRNGKEPEHINIPHKVNGFEYQINEVIECVSKYKLESDIMPLKESLEIMRIMDLIRDEWKLKYSCD